MTHEETPISELISTLKQERDELALKIHLGEAEAKQEFDLVTKKLDDLTREYDPVKDAVTESAEGVSESLKLVAEEVMSSFERIRKSL
jgi:chromosome segregation ATPase